MPMKSTIAAQMPPKLTDGRGGGIRTHDLFVPNEARYQAALRPDIFIFNELCDLLPSVLLIVR